MGDDGQFLARHGIGGVQPAAQPRLQHAVIRPRLRKGQHGHEKQILKKSGMIALSSLQGLPVQFFIDPQKDLQKRFPADHLSSDQKAFPHIHQMRRSKHRHLFSRRLQHAAQIGTDRALAVGPRHMQNAQACVRLSQAAQKFPGILRGVFGGKSGNIHNIFHCLLISCDLLSLHK